MDKKSLHADKWIKSSLDRKCVDGQMPYRRNVSLSCPSPTATLYCQVYDFSKKNKCQIFGWLFRQHSQNITTYLRINYLCTPKYQTAQCPRATKKGYKKVLYKIGSTRQSLLKLWIIVCWNYEIKSVVPEKNCLF